MFSFVIIKVKGYIAHLFTNIYKVASDFVCSREVKFTKTFIKLR